VVEEKKKLEIRNINKKKSVKWINLLRENKHHQLLFDVQHYPIYKCKKNKNLKTKKSFQLLYFLLYEKHFSNFFS